MEVFTIRMTSAFIVMIVPFINLHTKLTVQVFIYLFYLCCRSRQNTDMENTNLEYRHKLIVQDMAKNLHKKGF